MKNCFLKIFLIFLFQSFQISAATRNKITNEFAGLIEFETTSINFGSIKRGQKVSAKFKFTNKGQGPLTIQGVQAPCDCTTVEMNKGKVIKAGETGYIDIVFDSTDYSGQVTKAVTVLTNERTLSDRTLTISALVNSELEANPPIIDFGDVLEDQVKPQRVVLQSLERKDLLIEKVKYNENLFDIGYTKEGRDWVIITKLKPNLPIGFIKETIYVKTNSIDLPELPIPVRASVKGKITSFPAYLEFGSIVKSSSSNRTLNFTSNSNFDILSHKIELMVNGASIDNPDKTVNLAISPMPNHSKKLSLELLNTGQFQGSVHGKIIFETSNPLHKNLAVDFYSFFR